MFVLRLFPAMGQDHKFCVEMAGNAIKPRETDRQADDLGENRGQMFAQ